jgi:uncharacterized glyoxalase superfamily protein PhnB
MARVNAGSLSRTGDNGRTPGAATLRALAFTSGPVTGDDAAMINGAHAILYSDDAAATRATLAKVLGTRAVDAGGGWLIFALPPAEIAVHPAAEGGRAELYLMTDDVAATVAALQAEGIEVARPISDQGWGLLTAITLPGGVELGLYQPRHPTAAEPS